VEGIIGTQHGERSKQFGVIAAMEYERISGVSRVSDKYPYVTSARL
jgi:hypothetical protein